MDVVQTGDCALLFNAASGVAQAFFLLLTGFVVNEMNKLTKLSICNDFKV